jgi:hypothetical protein
MATRALGCSLADAFSGSSRTPTVATYQSRFAAAAAQTKTNAQAHAASVAYAPSSQPQPQAQPQAQQIDYSSSSSEDSDTVYRRKRAERKKRREQKHKRTDRRKAKAESDSESDVEVQVQVQPQARAQPQPQPQAGSNVVVAQGTAFPIASSYVRQSVGQASFAGALPAQGFSVAAATMGPPTSCTPQNPLGVDFGTGSQMYATGYTNNGMPQAVVDGRFDTIRSDRRDLAGTFVDPITGITYAGFTDSMPEPKVMREPPSIKLGEPNRMLEALTGVPQYTRPIRQEVFNDFSDVLEGVQIPQGLLELQTRDNAAKRVAADTFFTNREVENGFNDTHWDGYIGDTYVLRPVIDTQTLSDNSQTNTVVADFRSTPDLYSSSFTINDGTQWGGPLQPAVTVLGQDKATLPGRGTVDMPSLGQGVRLHGMPTKMSFSDDAPNTHANVSYTSPNAGGRALLAVAAQTSQDTTTASLHAKAVEMPYALYTPSMTTAQNADGGAGADAAVARLGAAQSPAQLGSMPATADPSRASDATASVARSTVLVAPSHTSQLAAVNDPRRAADASNAGPISASALGSGFGANIVPSDARMASDAVVSATQSAASFNYGGMPYAVLPAATHTGAVQDSTAAVLRNVNVDSTGNNTSLRGVGDVKTASDASAAYTRSGVDQYGADAYRLTAVNPERNAYDNAAALSFHTPTVVAETYGSSRPAVAVTTADAVVWDSAASSRPAVVQDFPDNRAYFASTNVRAPTDATAAPNRLNVVAASVTPWTLTPAVRDPARANDDAAVSAAYRARGDDFAYAQASMHTAAPERASAADAVYTPGRYTYNPTAAPNVFESPAALTSASSVVGAIEQASRRMASVNFNETATVYQTANTSLATVGNRVSSDASAAPSRHGYSGNATTTASAAAPAIHDANTVRDDSNGALRVDVTMPRPDDGGSRLYAVSRGAENGHDAALAHTNPAVTLTYPHGGGGGLSASTQHDIGNDEYASTRQAQTFDTTSGRDTAFAWSWDGRGTRFDDVARPAAVNVTELRYDSAGFGIGQASDRPAQQKAASETTPRVSNDMTLFATGQTMLPNDGIQCATSELDTGKDSTIEGDMHLGQTSLLRDAFLAAHPSTFGTAAEFRNTYKTTTRAGIVVRNLETDRLLQHPNLAARDAALLQQLARIEDTRRREKQTGNTMHAVRVAYESDAYASDA